MRLTALDEEHILDLRRGRHWQYKPKKSQKVEGEEKGHLTLGIAVLGQRTSNDSSVFLGKSQPFAGGQHYLSI